MKSPDFNKLLEPIEVLDLSIEPFDAWGLYSKKEDALLIPIFSTRKEAREFEHIEGFHPVKIKVFLTE